MWFASGWQARASLCTPDPDLTLGPGRSHFSNSILGRSHPKGFQPSKYLTCIVIFFFFFFKSFQFKGVKVYFLFLQWQNSGKRRQYGFLGDSTGSDNPYPYRVWICEPLVHSSHWISEQPSEVLTSGSTQPVLKGTWVEKCGLWEWLFVDKDGKYMSCNQMVWKHW